MKETLTFTEVGGIVGEGALGAGIDAHVYEEEVLIPAIRALVIVTAITIEAFVVTS